MKKIISFCIVLAVMIASVPARAVDSPWRWLLTMKAPRVGAKMNNPTALYVSGELGRYYVVDAGNNRLVSFDKEGKFLNAFNAGGKLKNPFDMTRDAEGRLWIVERSRNALTSIDLKSREVNTSAIENRGKTVILDRFELDAGVFYVIDRFSGDILALNSTLKIIRRYTCAECENGGFVDFKIHNGSIFALNQAGKAVFRFKIDGSLAEKISLRAEIAFPRSIAVDKQGYLYVLDRHSSEVVVFDRSGNPVYRFLSTGQAQGQVYYPIELRFDPWGRLCVVEEGNGRVQVFSRQ